MDWKPGNSELMNLRKHELVRIIEDLREQVEHSIAALDDRKALADENARLRAAICATVYVERGTDGRLWYGDDAVTSVMPGDDDYDAVLTALEILDEARKARGVSDGPHI